MSAVIVSGRSIFQVLVPAWAVAPLPERPDDVLLRSLLLALPPMPDVLERSAVLLLPVPELLGRLPLLEAAALAPAPEVLERSVLLLDELPMPLPEVELASLRGEELLEPKPLVEPLPVLEPLAPDAPDAFDSRTSETFTSGVP